MIWQCPNCKSSNDAAGTTIVTCAFCGRTFERVLGSLHSVSRPIPPSASKECPECKAGHPVETFPDGTRLHVHSGTAITCTAKDYNAPEPAPNPGTGVAVWDLVITDMRERDRLGNAKYKQRLTTYDGRRSLVDAYQEVLDLAVYLKKQVIEDEDGARLAKSLTLKHVIDQQVARSNRWHPGGITDWSALEWAGAMAGEAGEACNAAKKLKRIDDKCLNINNEPGRSLTTRDAARDAIGKEVADTILYAISLCAREEIDLEVHLVERFNTKSEEYGFPERL